MMGGNRQLFEDVLSHVEYWIPDKAYQHERKFQSELKELLETELNSANNDPLGMGMGGGQGHVIKKEHGSSRADIAVDEVVGIELKRNLSNSRAKRELRGQIEEYLDNYPFVIVCTCGLDGTARWQKLKNEYEGGNGFGLEDGEVAFVHKQKENYGKNPDSLNNSGGMFGGMF